MVRGAPFEIRAGGMEVFWEKKKKKTSSTVDAKKKENKNFTNRKRKNKNKTNFAAKGSKEKKLTRPRNPVEILFEKKTSPASETKKKKKTSEVKKKKGFTQLNFHIQLPENQMVCKLR